MTNDCISECEPLTQVATEYVSDGWQCWCNFEGFTTTPPTINEPPACESWSCGETVVEPEPIPVTGITIEPTTVEGIVGDTGSLTVTVEPSDADDTSYSLESSDVAVVTISSDGSYELVGEGTATITGTTTDGGFTATVTVTVTIPEEG